jgi:hypothetical protein
MSHREFRDVEYAANGFTASPNKLVRIDREHPVFRVGATGAVLGKLLSMFLQG